MLTSTHKLVWVEWVGFVAHIGVAIADTATSNRYVLNTVVILQQENNSVNWPTVYTLV